MQNNILNKKFLLLIMFFLIIIFQKPIFSEKYTTLYKQIKTNFIGIKNKKRTLRNLKQYLNTNNTEIKNGMDIILQKKLYFLAENKENYALHLFLFLLSKKCYSANDTITQALALANNYLYSIADDRTRVEIKRDLVKHYKYYLKVIKWQKSMKIKYRLKSVGVIPKIYWAYRVRSIDKPRRRNKLNLKTYKEFVDRIENLEQMHKYVKKLKLDKEDSLIHLARKAESFAKGSNLDYRARIEVHRKRLRKNSSNQNSINAMKEFKQGLYHTFYFGKKRRWDHFAWLNYQLKRFKKTGKFRGDCVTINTIQMNMYKAAGIPSFSNQIWSINLGLYHHNSPYFYNFFLKRWNSIQKPKRDKQGYYNYFSKPIFHHKVYEVYGKKYKRNGLKVHNFYWFGEKASYKQVVNLRKRGFEKNHFEDIFNKRITQQDGFVYNNKTAPIVMDDSDNDGITNQYEIKIGLDPKNADTDNDSYADGWEIEHGFDAKNNKSPNIKTTPAIDGIAKTFIKNNSMQTAYSKSGEYKATENIHDVKSISAKVIDKNIYIAVSYHNDIRKNNTHTYSFRITQKGRINKKYFFQWQRGNWRIYERVRAGNKTKLKQIDSQFWPVTTIEDSEFLFPIQYFKGADVLFVQYVAVGEKNNKTVISSDKSKMIRIDLKSRHIINNLIKEIKRLPAITDVVNDAKGEYNIQDIKSVRTAVFNNKLFFWVEYYPRKKDIPFGIHSFDVYPFINNGKYKRSNKYFFQTWRLNMCNVYHKKKKTKLKLNKFDIIPFENSNLFVFDISYISTRKFRVRYRVGAKSSDNKTIINSDVSKYFIAD